MKTSAVRTAQLKLALMGLIERADEQEVRELCLQVLEVAPNSGALVERAGVAAAFDELAIALRGELVESLQRAADHAGFLAQVAARHGNVLVDLK